MFGSMFNSEPSPDARRASSRDRDAKHRSRDRPKETPEERAARKERERRKSSRRQRESAASAEAAFDGSGDPLYDARLQSTLEASGLTPAAPAAPPPAPEPRRLLTQRPQAAAWT